MAKTFEVDGVELTTSSYTKQKETDWCVGVGSVCSCHKLIGDSKTKKFTLSVDNSEFLALVGVAKI